MSKTKKHRRRDTKGKGIRRKHRDDKNARAAADTAARARRNDPAPEWTENIAETATRCSLLRCAARIERGEPVWAPRGSRAAVCTLCHAKALAGQKTPAIEET